MNHFLGVMQPIKLLHSIGIALGYARNYIPDDTINNASLDKRFLVANFEHTEIAIDILLNKIGFAEWDSVRDRIEILRDKLSPNMSVAELHIEIEGINRAIEKELRKRWFRYIQKDKALLERGAESDWSSIIRAFPKTKPEITDGMICYSSGANSAAVFHMMRVVEIGLRAVAKERKIQLPKAKPLEWGTWHDVLKELDAAVKAIASKRAGAPKDKALAFYSGIIADLNSFKDEYRNQLMHVRIAYDEHQALKVINKVRYFMERLSEKIDDRHYRVRWGLK